MRLLNMDALRHSRRGTESELNMTLSGTRDAGQNMELTVGKSGVKGRLRARGLLASQ